MPKVPAPPASLPVTNPGVLGRMQQRFQRVAAWSSRRTSTTASAGTSGSLPAQVAGYVDIEIIDSTTGQPSRRKIPFYLP